MHYVGSVVAYTWNREKQMFVALGKEFDMFRTLLHLGQLLHLGLQQTGPSPRSTTDCLGDKSFSFSSSHLARAKFYVCVADNIGRIANRSLRVFGRANRARNGLC